MKFGSLQEVDVRKLWKHEQYDFSEWLSKEDNLELLGDILGLSLIDVDKEVYVGAYRCDLVAKDEATGIKVIIENQLEASNHDHLGKIITYASGLDAKVVVWIVTHAREEHRSAIDWLNNNTSEDLNFFLIEIHAFTIGDSLPAPKFEVIEQPNNFIKYTKSINGSGEISKSQAECMLFWNELNSVLEAKNYPFSKAKASTDHWRNVAIGTSDAVVSINLVNKDSSIVVDLYIYNNKGLFDKLYALKDNIEEELGFVLDWQRMDNKKASRIKHTVLGLNFEDHSNYSALIEEVISKVLLMKKVFIKYIKSFDK